MRRVELPGKSTSHGGIDRNLLIDSEHVDSAVLLLVLLLTDVANLVSDDFALKIKW